MNTTICDILNNFKRPLRKIAYLHYKDYRYLLPESIKKFPQKNKFRHDNVSYDLYGWSSEQGLTIIDIYPTYKNIITKEDLPLSWQNYIQTIKNIINIQML